MVTITTCTPIFNLMKRHIPITVRFHFRVPGLEIGTGVKLARNGNTLVMIIPPPPY